MQSSSEKHVTVTLHLFTIDFTMSSSLELMLSLAACQLAY